MEDFITYELAVKLKEKGFDIPFYFYYRTDDKHLRHANVTNPLVYCDKIDDEVVIAPTIYQVLKWLRKEKKIHLVVDIDSIGYFFTLNYDITINSNNEYTYNMYIGLSNYYNAEQAYLAGIEYVIYNRI